MWLIVAAHATEDQTFGGFAVEGRADAPTDAVLLVAADYHPAVAVVSGPDAGAQLAVRDVAQDGAVPLVAAGTPPEGWLAGALYTVEAGSAQLSFGVADDPAADPVVPEVSAVTATDRWVSVEVESADPDPWSSVLLTDPDGAGLVGSIGPGVRTLTYEPRGRALPECVGVVGVAADGDRSDAVSICLDDVRRGRVCATAPADVGLAWLGVLVIAVRRR